MMSMRVAREMHQAGPFESDPTLTCIRESKERRRAGLFRGPSQLLSLRAACRRFQSDLVAAQEVNSCPTRTLLQAFYSLGFWWPLIHLFGHMLAAGPPHAKCVLLPERSNVQESPPDGAGSAVQVTQDISPALSTGKCQRVNNLLGVLQPTHAHTTLAGRCQLCAVHVVRLSASLGVCSVGIGHGRLAVLSFESRTSATSKASPEIGGVYK